MSDGDVNGRINNNVCGVYMDVYLLIVLQGKDAQKQVADTDKEM